MIARCVSEQTVSGKALKSTVFAIPSGREIRSRIASSNVAIVPVREMDSIPMLTSSLFFSWTAVPRWLLSCCLVLCSSQVTLAQNQRVESDQASETIVVPVIPITRFAPVPKLRVRESFISKAAFPVVDVHTHFRNKLRENPDGLEQFVRTMDENGIAVCVSLDGTLGEPLQRHIDFLWTKYRDRFVIFANIDWRGKGSVDDPSSWDCHQPDFVRNVVEGLRGARRQGISGLKIFKQFGLGVKNPDGTFVAIDDERWDPIWAVCGELGMPVIIHSADPSAFFDPIDERNERAEELIRHPDWHFPAERFPSRESLHAARNHVAARHPKTVFIYAHLGNDAEDLEQTAAWLDAYPNVVVEIAARISELGRQPRAARAFFKRYQDRIMFGTDGPLSGDRLRLYWRLFETEDEYFPYAENPIPPQGLWRIYGLGLGTEALRKIYYANAARIIPGVAERLERFSK